MTLISYIRTRTAPWVVGVILNILVVGLDCYSRRFDAVLVTHT